MGAVAPIEIEVNFDELLVLVTAEPNGLLVNIRRFVSQLGDDTLAQVSGRSRAAEPFGIARVVWQTTVFQISQDPGAYPVFVQCAGCKWQVDRKLGRSFTSWCPSPGS